jgi:hypothetical protein
MCPLLEEDTMASNAGKIDISGYQPLADPAMIEKHSYNTRLKVGRLVREITHQHNYGVAIMAQQQRKVNTKQQLLVEMGFPEVELVKPDFSDPEKLEILAKLSAYQG